MWICGFILRCKSHHVFFWRQIHVKYNTWKELLDIAGRWYLLKLPSNYIPTYTTKLEFYKVVLYFFACSFFSILRYWYVILRTYMVIIRNSLFSRKVEFVVGGNNFFPKIIDRVSWRRRRRRRCRPWFLLIFFSRDYSRYAILYTRVFVYHYAQ